jgi:hypothetical protein
MRLLLRAFVVVSSVAVAFLAWHYLRPAAATPAVEQKSAAGRTAAIKPIEAASLQGTYQGPITRANGTEEWLVLEITNVTAGANHHVTFGFTLSSITYTVREEGTASLDNHTIRFAGLSGEIRRRDDGMLVLRSTPIAGPPHWMLEPPRTDTDTVGETQT